jgi:lipid-A-disaccharide synthase-like uncharacterized protein
MRASPRTDLLVAALTSTLLAGYLLAALLAPPHAHAAAPPDVEFTAPPAAATSAADAEAVEATRHAPWVERNEPVPPEALYPYGQAAPPPEAPAKPRSFLNRLFFPEVRCPYCGRRVPTKKTSYAFLLIGFVGQVAFSMRFLVQWIASERRRASVIPEAFWWLSIVGSLLLLVYAIHILAWPIIIGQAPNCLIYGRNLYFIKKAENAVEPAEPLPPEESDR